MTSLSPSKDKFFEKVITPYLPEVMRHPQTIKMREWVLHIRDVQGPKKEGSEKARITAVEQEIFKCQGMVERGLSDNHYMITDFIEQNILDTQKVGEILFKLQEQIDHLQDEVYELQSQNCEYESRFQRISFAASFRTPKITFSYYDGECTCVKDA
ncbi:40S ribosomal protein S5-1 [Hordeum vulgare]|nr:40S ribosomal protein S5-1 [Hordeum vulgare]